MNSERRSRLRHAIMWPMIEYALLLLALLRATVCSRAALAAENLLLRQQLAVLTRPTRKRPRGRARDKLFWLLVRLVRRDWRRHLVLVRPETVVRWHRQGHPLPGQAPPDVGPLELHHDRPLRPDPAHVPAPVDEAQPGVGVDLRRRRRAGRGVREGDRGRAVGAAAGLVRPLGVVALPE